MVGADHAAGERGDCAAPRSDASDSRLAVANPLPLVQPLEQTQLKALMAYANKLKQASGV